MMNKEGFLKELQARIAVLEDAEQQDILAEYAQHIDLRVAGGLTEQEAIRDFGDLDQLAAEILEAYHVKPAFRKRLPGAKAGSLPDLRPGLRRAVAKTAGFFRRCAQAAARFFRRLGRGTAAVFSKLGRGAAALFSRLGRGMGRLFRRGKPESSAEIKEEHPTMDTTTSKHRFSGIGRAMGRLGRGIGRLIRTAAQLAWNLLLLLCAVPFAGLGLAFLICLGLLVVLLFQGYPLVGAALCCAGGTACCVGILGLGSSLVWRRHTAPANGPSVPLEPTADSPLEEDSSEPSEQEVAQLIAQTVENTEEEVHFHE